MSTTPLIPDDLSLDEHEHLALQECAKRFRLDRRVSVLLIPAARCELATRFAELGAQCVVADTEDRGAEIQGRILASGYRDQILFQPTPLPAMSNPDLDIPGTPFDIIILRRGLCYLPYPEAKQMIRALLRRLRIGGRLYLSILGLNSALGDHYPHRNFPINQRFSHLDKDLSEKYGLTQKLCLYSERDLFLLLLESGASVLRTTTTTYGNVKAVAGRV